MGLDDLDIPTNPELEIEVVDASDEECMEAVLRISGECFKMTQQQVDKTRANWHEHLKQPNYQQQERVYLGRLDGLPVAMARLYMNAGLAYLGGAATLPEYRRRSIYSSLLRRRLVDARDLGYHVAIIDAGPMSRRVVKRYGFREYGRFDVYGWMPVMDMEVIRTLISDN